MSRSEVLVEADWVQDHLGDPGVVLVEVDEDTTAYDKGHIKGAVKLDWRKDLQDPVRRDFVDKAGFERLLDGGRKKWELDSRDMVTDVPSRPATSYRAEEQDRSIRAFRDDVLAAIGNLNLVDVRSPDEFTGRLLAPPHLPQEQAQRGGHVPTAKNVPWSKAAEEDGTFKSDQALAELYGDA